MGKKTDFSIHFGRDEWEKWKLPVLLLVFGAGAAILASVMGVGEKKIGQGGKLIRPEEGRGTEQVVLEAVWEDSRKDEIAFEIAERKLTEQQLEKAFKEAKEQLVRKCLGTNKSQDAVSENLNFMDRLEGLPFEISWQSMDYELIDAQGEVHNEKLKEETLVDLQAVLEYGEDSRIICFTVCVQPKEYPPEEYRKLQLKEAVEKLLELNQTESEIYLPEEWNGEKIQWKRKGGGKSFYLFLLGAVGAVFVLIGQEKDRRRKEEEKERMFEQDYPEFVSRLVLLVGIGLPVRRAVYRIAEDYGKKKEEGLFRPAYEELIVACREMENGCTEQQAYEQFGKRCGLPRYRKCAALLAQNVRKGSEGLLKALQEEAEDVFEERKREARRKGEEAGTKLLLPMMMMLFVVMILIMVPAIFSFGGI